MNVSSSLVQSASNLSLLNAAFGSGGAPAAVGALATAQPSVPSGLVDFPGLVSQLAGSTVDSWQQMAASALATLGAPPDLYSSLGTYNLINQSTPDLLKGLLLDRQV